MAEAVQSVAEIAETNSPRNRGMDFHTCSAQDSEIFISRVESSNNLSNEDANSKSDSEKSVNPNLKSDSSQETTKSDEKTRVLPEDSQSSANGKKKRNIFLSDSEDDENSIILELENDSGEKSLDGASNCVETLSTQKDSFSKVHKSLRHVDSDSDDDKTIVESKENNGNDSSDGNQETETITKKPTKSRFRTLIDSDSDEESKTPTEAVMTKGNEHSDKDNNEINAKDSKKKSKISAIVDSESDIDNGSDDSVEEVRTKAVSTGDAKTKIIRSFNKSRHGTFLDTDTESEPDHNAEEENNEHESNSSAKKSKKSGVKRQGSVRAAKDEAMRNIHSETQRLIRSSEISLPYHRPKQRSLKDFLNRKRFIPELPQGLTTAARVRMSSEIVGKVLKEKEKEAQLFYKSSDSEEEAITLPSADPIEAAPTQVDEEIAIEDTQKPFKNDIQNCHNKKQIIQQGGVDIGIPRKLFIDELNDFPENDRPTRTESIETVPEEVNVDDLKRKQKEMKQGMRDGSAPRKLFPIDYDEDNSTKEPEIVTKDPATTSEHSPEEAEVAETNSDDGVHLTYKTSQSVSSDRDAATEYPDSGLPESCDENSGQDVDTVVSNGVKESFDLVETPFISNKEYAKWNEREKSDEKSTEATEKGAFSGVYGLPMPDTDEIPAVQKASERKKKLLSTISKVSPGVPRLSGAPGSIIDFNDDDLKSNRKGVQSLVDRFIRHSTVNKPSETGSPVMYIEKTPDGKIIEQALPYKLPTTDVARDKDLEKPGAKYFRLKNDLIEKMSKKREEEWKLKEQQQEKEEQEQADMSDNEFDDDDDVNLADEEFTTESEPEEDDMPQGRKKKKLKKKPRAFADEEAEVSGEDDVMEVDEEDEEIDEEVDEKGPESVDLASDNDSDVGDSTEAENKKPSRIVKAFEDDSNSESEALTETNVEKCHGKVFERTKTDVDMFEDEDWLTDTENEFPPSQVLPRDRADARSQLCKTPLTSVNVLRFVSPITQLTALNSCVESPASRCISQLSQRVFTDKTPNAIKHSPISCDSDKRAGLQKKLFEEPAGTVNDDELIGLCSGNFTGTETDDRGLIDPMQVSNNGKVTETQLLRLCSGSFPSQGLLDFDKYDNKINGISDENSQDIRLTLDDDSCDVPPTKLTAEKASASKPWSLRVESSSDEDHDQVNESLRKRKKTKKLELSDDEEDKDEREFSDEEEDILDDDGDAEAQFIDYDSEENEVVTIAKKDIKKVAAKFLEAEAELSESEWGSADEDEKDLDKFEVEEGDDEEIDENQMRDQLGKIHMRQVQDDDQRDVRMLQELLFDDGDLHTDGSGRERKFRWKNVDDLGDDNNAGPRDNDEDAGDPQEDDNDLEWRKERLEREKFIEDKMKSVDDELADELAADSQVFKLGIKALKRGKSSQGSVKEVDPVLAKKVAHRTVLDLVGSPSMDQHVKIVHKAVSRGSFLARGDECLARLAVHIKDQTEIKISNRKNPKNFVFKHISPSTANTFETEVEDDAEDTTNNISINSKGKKRKPAAGITPRSTKKAKIEITRTTGKKLFRQPADN